jgi:tetratricopeptide (TPR) repeat protein
MDDIETAKQLFFDGLAQLENSDFATAERLFTECLLFAPQSISALSNLAIAQFRQKRFAACDRTAERLIALDPRNIDGYEILSSSQKEQGHYAEALSSCDKLIELDPSIAETYSNRAFLLKTLGRREEALAAYDKALSLGPDSAAAWFGRGDTLYELQRHSDALAAFDRALALDADLASAWIGRGHALWNLKRYHEASEAYDKALAIAPEAENAWLGRGNVLFDLKGYEEASAAFDRALSIAPDLAGAWLGRGNVCWSLHRNEDALAAYDKALSIAPDLPVAWLGRGNALADMKRFDDAFAAFDRALSLEPDLAQAWLGRGNAFGDLKRFDDALAAYGKATSLDPDLGEAHFNAALLRLLSGDLAAGLPKYEYRWAVKQQRDMKRDFSQPIWLGDSDISGKTILIHAEQGLGDTLMCCRYIPMLAARGARVILEVQPALLPLLRTLDGVSTLIAKGETKDKTIPDFDLHCPMMSLPLAFKTTVATIPSHVPYLSVAAETIERWRSKLAGQDPKAGLKVGITWAGSPRFIKDADRSVLLPNILPLLAVEGVSYVCLQKELRDGDETILDAHPHIARLDREVSDFSDTAALMMSLDLIISSDTAVANLAGALGRKVWVLLPFLPDWRWSLAGDSTPWYPTATLFRQQKPGDWSSVIDRATEELKKLSQ